MITEDYVSFEVAKLLKEKGFDADITTYRDDFIQHGNVIIPLQECLSKDNVKTPSIQMAMKWLREVHNLHCDIGYDDMDWFWGIISTDKAVPPEERPKVVESGYAGCKSYEEAAEAAIKYCLKNLIKNEDDEEESDISVPKTVNEAIYTLEKILSDEDREYLLKNGAISMHDSLGRWIRNEWGLWTGSELKDELMNMNKGLNHPDDMSNYIIEEFIKYWNNKI